MSLLPSHSAEVFSRVFHVSPVSFWICSLDEGRFLEVNGSFLRLVGFNRDEVIGHTDVELGLWADPKAREELNQRLAERIPMHDFEWRVHTKKGELRTTLASVELIEVQGESCLLFSAHDLTERLNREVQLRQSQKMEAVGQLAAGFAHDFNNILAIVQGYTSILLDEPALDRQTNKALKEVSTAAERAANLTRRLLTFSRKQFMQPKAIDLNQVFQGLASMLQRLLGEKVVLKFDVGPRPLHLKADASMVEQMIVNLAANARDAMPQGGQFTLAASLVDVTEGDVRARPNARPGSFARISVIDTGCGMSPGDIESNF